MLKARHKQFVTPCVLTVGDGGDPVPTPVLEYFTPDWIPVAADIQVVELRIIASPPVAAGVGIVVFARRTPTDPAQQPPFSRIGSQVVIDNLPNTPAGSAFQLPVQRGLDYVVRFQGEAHLLVPGFQSITVGFVLSHGGGPITNFDGAKTANNTRVAAINGQTFFRHA